MEKGVDVKFGLDDLVAEPEQTAHWDGVRNYLARSVLLPGRISLFSLHKIYCMNEIKASTTFSIIQCLARNHMRSMKVGHTAFFYHSNCKPPGIAGIVKVRELKHTISLQLTFASPGIATQVVKESYVDHTQFDRADPHFDPKSSRDNPKEGSNRCLVILE